MAKFSIVVSLEDATEKDAQSVFKEVACLDLHGDVSDTCIIERELVEGDVLQDRVDLIELSKDVLVEAGELASRTEVY